MEVLEVRDLICIIVERLKKLLSKMVVYRIVEVEWWLVVRGIVVVDVLDKLKVW